jgi:hypothetical protein
MTVHLALAPDPNFIEESQYGTAPQVQFSPITSCILIAGRTADGSVAGIHLVMFQPDDQPFGADPNDVATVTARIGALTVTPPSIIVFGQTQMWHDNVGPAFQTLLGNLGDPPVTDLNDGTYGANAAGQGVAWFQVQDGAASEPPSEYPALAEDEE